MPTTTVAPATTQDQDDALEIRALEIEQEETEYERYGATGIDIADPRYM